MDWPTNFETERELYQDLIRSGADIEAMWVYGDEQFVVRQLWRGLRIVTEYKLWRALQKAPYDFDKKPYPRIFDYKDKFPYNKIDKHELFKISGHTGISAPCLFSMLTLVAKHGWEKYESRFVLK
jgi:hypothetical protein